MAGRPRKELNWDIVENRMRAGETALSIAARHHVNVNLFYKKFREHYGCSFQDYAPQARDVGKSDILFTQYMKAKSGNTKMLELLGREWCGQGKNEVQKSPYEDMNSLIHENMILKAELDSIREKMSGNKPETE